MKETILKIINAGGTVKFKFKYSRKEYMTEASIYNFIFYGINKYIVKTGNSKEFDDASEAVDYYMSKVFSTENYAYKWHEALLEMSKINPNFDLDDNDDYETFNDIRQKIIKSNFNQES